MEKADGNNMVTGGVAEEKKAIMETIGKNVERIRLAKGWDRDVLGDLSEVGQKKIYALERLGTGSIANLVLVAQALGVSLDTLADWTPPRKRHDDGIGAWDTWQIMPELQSAIAKLNSDVQQKLLELIRAIVKMKDAEIVVRPKKKS